MAARSGSGLTPRDELDAALHDWLRSDKQVLHVEGPPGSGKTSWVQLLVAMPEIRDAGGHLLACHGAHHLCRYGEMRTGSVNVFLAEIAVQLAQREPRYAQALVERGRGERAVKLDVQIDARGSTNASVVGIAIQQLVMHAAAPGDMLHDVLNPLVAILAEPGPDWLIVVDAPDEPKDRSVADLLVALGPMPARLRWLITSRPNPAFARHLNRAGAAHLDLTVVGAGSTSLARFVCTRARDLGVLDRLADGADAGMFLAALGERVHDNFLVARCALDALAASSGPLDDKAVEQLPATLPGYYLASLDAIYRTMEDTWIDDCGPLLGSLAVARMPLAEAELAVLTGLPETRVRDRLRRLQAYLNGSQDGWRLFHATFAEFLLDRSAAQDFWCKESEQHQRFVRFILAPGHWNAAPAYGAAHIVSHIIGADEPALLDQLDGVLAADFIAVRLSRGETAADLSADFKRMLMASCARADVPRTVLLTLLLALWQDLASTSAAPASTILLAAMGRVAEASALAQRQDAAGHEDAISGSKQRAGYAARLVRIDKIDAAVDFARAAAANGDPYPLLAVLEELALRAPARAIALLQQAPFAERVPQLSPQACRGLASSAAGVALALSAARNEAARVAVAEGCAVHDVDRALALVAAVDPHVDWIGGEHAVVTPHVAAVRVLCAFVKAHPARSADAWGRANDALPGRWPVAHGLLLADAFASADASLAVPALAKLPLLRFGVPPAVAVAWMGRHNARVLAALQAAVPLVTQSGSDKHQAAMRPFARASLDDALQMLALIAPEQIPRDSAAFAMLQEVGDLLLETLMENPARPERKSSGALALGRFFGWLGKAYVDRIVSHGEAHWRREAWQYALGEGVAASLAHQGSDIYRRECGQFDSYLSADGALRVAVEIIAQHDPDEALRLIDSVPMQYSITRAELVSITAVAVWRSGPEALAALPQRLSGYTRSAAFLEVAGAVGRALDDADAPAHPDVIALYEQVHAAMKAGDEQALFRASRDVDNVRGNASFRYRGRVVGAGDVRRLLSGAFSGAAPSRALRVLMPIASAGEMQVLARAICARHPAGDTQAKAASLLFIFHEVPDTGRMMHMHDMVLAFALAQPRALQGPFLDHFRQGPDGMELCGDVEEVLAAYAEPEGAIVRLLAKPPRFLHIWIVLHVLSELSRHHHHLAFGAFDAALTGEEGALAAGSMLQQIALDWPIAHWRAAVDAYFVWAMPAAGMAAPPALHANTFFGALLARVAELAPADALDALREVNGKLGAMHFRVDNACADIIEAAACVASPNAASWPLLVARASQIGDHACRFKALTALLHAVPNLPLPAQAQQLCAVVAALVNGPREPLLRELDAIVYTARAVDPLLAGTGGALVERLAALLQAAI